MFGCGNLINSCYGAFMLTQERLQEVLRYDAATGAFTWRAIKNPTTRGERLRNSKFAGKVAGCLHTRGYVHITIDGTEYKAHRLAFLYMTGSTPLDQIDHVNHDKSDNRWENLREVSQAANGRNRPMHRNNTSGHTGVYNTAPGKWLARIFRQGRFYNLGTFSSMQAAIDARTAAEGTLGFHSNHGRRL